MKIVPLTVLKVGYSSEIEEASIASTPASPQMQRQFKDKTQMQPKGQAPNLKTAFSEFEPKKESAGLQEASFGFLKGNQPNVKYTFARYLQDIGQDLVLCFDANRQLIGYNWMGTKANYGPGSVAADESKVEIVVANSQPQQKEAVTPSDKEEKWRDANEADFKKRYGKAYKDRLYSKAKEKFRK